MTSFRILSEASEELEVCVSYYNSQRSNLGTEFLAEFERTAERILKLPNAARMVGEDIKLIISGHKKSGPNGTAEH